MLVRPVQVRWALTWTRSPTLTGCWNVIESITTVTTRARAWRMAASAPAVSTSFMIAPPCTSPCGLASVGSICWARTTALSSARRGDGSTGPPAARAYPTPVRGSDWLTLTVLAAIWGASYLFIRIAAPAVGPLPLMATRVLLAGVVLAALAAALGRLPPVGERWRAYVRLGLVNAAVPFTLIAAAELYVTASLAGIVTTTAPLFSALVAAAWLKDPLTARTLLGLLLGSLGVVVLVGWSPLPLGSALLLSVAGLLAASFCYGLGAVYTRASFRDVPPLGLATAQQLAAGAVLLVPAVATAGAPWPQPPAVVLSVLALALLSTALAYLIYFRLIARVGPTRALMVSILVPFFGVLWGVVFLGEPVTPGTFAGLVIVLGGVAMASGATACYALGVKARLARLWRARRASRTRPTWATRSGPSSRRT